ncbi:hypothetical protein HMPREF9156_00752 [Scardovia wiggsiae F0424]|uniref:Uncharacterized protein n=1 Tax=Scardovia wiggsiae F0424 TaxID=857290 RepID=J0LM22_9BIFI|nr:AAA family ATPase [Scardovia wiggsiae]EJD64877.1 hypothetical protein HMPREF9156_00752 [Scardovia wiggsiae F0424]
MVDLLRKPTGNSGKDRDITVYLKKVKIKNFQSFGSEQTINFNECTTFIGSNGSGKTAALVALSKIFSTDMRVRALVREDFHIDEDRDPSSVENIEMFIEAVFGFEQSSFKEDIPEYFDSFVIDKEEKEPILRVRLEATWSFGTSIEGDIDSKTYFVKNPENVKKEDERKEPAERTRLNRIRLIYIPAVRNPGDLLRSGSRNILQESIQQIGWSLDTKNIIEKKIKELNDTFMNEEDAKKLGNFITESWGGYENDPRYKEASLSFSTTDFASTVKSPQVTFSPGINNKDYTIDYFSDGQRSLLYFSLIGSAIDFEYQNKQKMFIRNKPTSCLTLIAVEEPENHVAPHLLGQLVNRLKQIAGQKACQVIITSHSSSIVKRVDPESICYFRLDKGSCTNCVPITLDHNSDAEDQKYVKEAIMAYPELYFADLVVLGEGDSEEIILPKVLESLGGNVDSQRISVVPLGGRHVNYFWKLLRRLNIPYVTLLDFDQERYGGGWGRIVYIVEQLQLLDNDFADADPVTGKIIELPELEARDSATAEDIEKWIGYLEKKYGVFFSAPLDIDFLMLEAYPEKYKSLARGLQGPRNTEGENAIRDAIRAVLHKKGGVGATYNSEQKKYMVWYRYLFLNRGKPATHIRVLSLLDEDTFQKNVPGVLKRLVSKVSEILKQNGEDTNA